MSEETAIISKQDYERLIKASEWLGWLEAAGVDNSDAWAYALELREQFLENVE